MSAPGQLDLDGGEVVDDRVEKAAKALWARDAKRTWWVQEDEEYHTKTIWPRVRAEYMAAAEAALRGAGVL